jgi:hypothetical protein
MKYKAEKRKHSSTWAWCEKAIGYIYFTKKWGAETLQPADLEFGYFKPWLKKRFLLMYLLAERFVFRW